MRKSLSLIVVLAAVAGVEAKDNASAQGQLEIAAAQGAAGAGRWADNASARPGSETAVPATPPSLKIALDPAPLSNPRVPAPLVMTLGDRGSGYDIPEEGFAYGWKYIQTPARALLGEVSTSFFGVLLGLILAPIALLVGLSTAIGGTRGRVRNFFY